MDCGFLHQAGLAVSWEECLRCDATGSIQCSSAWHWVRCRSHSLVSRVDVLLLRQQGNILEYVGLDHECGPQRVRLFCRVGPCQPTSAMAVVLPLPLVTGLPDAVHAACARCFPRSGVGPPLRGNWERLVELRRGGAVGAGDIVLPLR